MSKNDEFESLIHNFKLDDVQPEETPPVRRQAFDYDKDAQRHMVSGSVPRAAASAPQAQRPAPQAQRPPQQAQRPAQQAGYQGESQRRSQPARLQPQAAEPRYSGQAAIRAQQEKKRNFHVNIDDRAFYETSGGRAPLPQGSGGGGRGGRGGRGDDDMDDERTPSGAGRWIKALIALLIVLAVSVFLAMFALESASDLFGLNKPEGEVEFELPDGLSLSETASMLQDEGIISQPLTFQLYTMFKKQEDNFIPGEYILNKNMSYDEIINHFRSGSNKPQEEVTLMFYEGMTLSEIADKLESEGVCDAQELLDYLDAGEFSWEYDFLQQVPDTPDRFRRWEGYFFPDTYIFYKGTSPEGVALKFFSNFNNRITDEMLEKMEQMGLTLDETITLASIIQREAGDPEEMGKVSSVFHNRLAEGSGLPQLQSDVTRDYVNNYIKPFLPDAVDKEANPDAVDPNQDMYDAYNTYVCAGLPVGPVCNPGLDAIEAALNPEQTNYLFFVTDEAGNYYYATTLAEHDQNVAIAAQNGKVHGTDAAEEVAT